MGLNRRIVLAGFVVMGLLPAIAAGQPVQRQPFMGMPGARPSPPADGITVSATGFADAPADSATVTLRLFSQKGSLTPQVVSQVVDAMVAAGVDRAKISTPSDDAPQAIAERGALLSAVIDHPTAAMIKAAIPSIVKLAMGMPADVNAMAEVKLTVTDCEPLANQARAAGIRLARQRAGDAARDLGVQVGAVRGFASFEAPAETDGGGCSVNYNFGSYNSGGGLLTKPEEFFIVHVSSNVTVRYAIK